MNRPFKNTRLALVIGIILTLTVGAGVYWWQSFPKEERLQEDNREIANLELKECVESKKRQVGKRDLRFTDRLIIGYRDGVSADEAKEILQSYGLQIDTVFKVIPFISVNVLEGKGLEWACRLEKDPKIKSVEFDIPVPLVNP